MVMNRYPYIQSGQHKNSAMQAADGRIWYIFPELSRKREINAVF